MKRWAIISAFWLAFCLWLANGALAQTNPCTTGSTALQINPTVLYVEMADFNTPDLDGQPAVSDLPFALYLEGSDPNTTGPIQGPSTLPRSAFTLVAGTADCYEAALPGTIPSARRLVAALRYHRAERNGLPEAWSAWTVSLNPFGSASGVLSFTPGAITVVGE